MVSSKFLKIWSAALLVLLAFSLCAFAAQGEGPRAKLTAIAQVEVALEGTPPEVPENHVIELKADDVSFPMPEGAVDGRSTITVEGPGSATFPVLEFDQLGIYTYTITQRAGSEPTVIHYDEKAYNLKITVYRDETTDQYYLQEALREAGGEDKTDIAVFLNQYEIELTQVSIAKVWNDAVDQDGLRPAELTVTLSDGQTATLNAENDWSATISDIPRFEENSRDEIEYTWTEEEIAGYTLTETVNEENVTTFTNTHIPATRSLTVRKLWQDEDETARPENLIMVLMGGDSPQTVTLNAANNWEATLENMPVNRNGAPIQYTWLEPRVNGYTQTAAVTEGDVTTFTNTRNQTPPDDREFTVTVHYRYWNGETAAESVREIHKVGEDYNITSPQIPGYRCSRPLVAGQQPARNIEFVVIYTPDNITIIDPPTPLGVGTLINVGDCLE